jgi:DNA modification methylase
VGNIWEAVIPTQGTSGNGTFAHSCPLPVPLVQQILKLATRRDDAVLDPFAGSGSTLVAAATLGRRYFGLDLNPRYVEMFSARSADEIKAQDSAYRPPRDLVGSNLRLRQLNSNRRHREMHHDTGGVACARP